MNFDKFKKIIGDANEAIRMEQSLYYGGKAPLDTYATPFDTFVDVCRSFDDKVMYSGMRVTILNADNADYPQCVIQLGVNSSGETVADWRLMEMGVFKKKQDIIDCFKTKTVSGKTYIQYHIVPVGFEFFVVDSENVFNKYRCIGYDRTKEEIILDNVTTIKIGGDDYVK